MKKFIENNLKFPQEMMVFLAKSEPIIVLIATILIYILLYIYSVVMVGWLFATVIVAGSLLATLGLLAFVLSVLCKAMGMSAFQAVTYVKSLLNAFKPQPEEKK